MPDKHVILIGGPTASGKSAFAMQIARRNNGAIINADAMQIYAGLPVLTAQPKPEDTAEIPHLLYQVTDAAESSSAGKWLALARAAIAETHANGRVPILVGGTGMYFAALHGGLADIPPIPPQIRDHVTELYLQWGEDKFRAELAKNDPDSAARIAPNDRQRLIRAYEVIMHTGKCLGDWHRAGNAEIGIGLFEIEKHLLLPEREIVYANCDRRFELMIKQGAIDEVEKLMARNLAQSLPAMKILGVREIAGYLRGETPLPAAIAKAQQMTRNYAKRQMTWFRNSW